MREEDDPSIDSEGRVELGELVSGGLVPVEVVFTVEARFFGGGAVEGESGTKGRQEHGGVQDGQRTREGGVEGGDVSVWGSNMGGSRVCWWGNWSATNEHVKNAGEEKTNPKIIFASYSIEHGSRVQRW